MALNWPLEGNGAHGENVKTVQYLLTGQGHPVAVDGIFGPLTTAAVRAVQTSKGLHVDGVVGNQTWAALIIQVRVGNSGDAVRAIQSQITSRRASAPAINGSFDSETDTAVQQFQRILGLSVDGIVGPNTWNAYVSGYLPGPDAVSAGEAMYQAWTRGDRGAAAKNASPAAVSQLFAKGWSSGAGWTFVGTDGGAGTIFLTWRQAAGGQLILAASDGPAGYFYVDSVEFR
jgi:hypothetical protein